MGGGALMTPVLVLFFGVPPLAAVSSDLVVSAVMKPVGGLVHLRRGTVDLRLGGLVCLGSVPRAFCGGLGSRALRAGARVPEWGAAGLGRGAGGAPPGAGRGRGGGEGAPPRRPRAAAGGGSAGAPHRGGGPRGPPRGGARTPPRGRAGARRARTGQRFPPPAR